MATNPCTCPDRGLEFCGCPAPRTDTYQGHLPDGSGIQKHSAGGIYPYVLVAQESPLGLLWGVLQPGDEEPRLWWTSTPGCKAYDAAAAEAERLIDARTKG